MEKMEEGELRMRKVKKKREAEHKIDRNEGENKKEKD